MRSVGWRRVAWSDGTDGERTFAAFRATLALDRCTKRIVGVRVVTRVVVGMRFVARMAAALGARCSPRTRVELSIPVCSQDSAMDHFSAAPSDLRSVVQDCERWTVKGSAWRLRPSGSEQRAAA